MHESAYAEEFTRTVFRDTYNSLQRAACKDFIRLLFLSVTEGQADICD